MKQKIILLIAILMLFTVACSKQEDVSKEIDKNPPKKSEPVAKEEPKQVFTHTFPLTGIGTNDEITQRPYAIMVNNHPKARPQSGLHMADLVYEVLAEGDVTRFLAVFQSEKPEIIGPVRSARDYYIRLSTGFDAFYVAHGWSPDAHEMLVSGEIDNINGMEYDGSLFWRADHRSAPHNSYISYENVMKGADKEGASMEQQSPSFSFLTEEEVAKIDGTAAEKVKVSYSSRGTFSVEYSFNSTLGRYERYSDGEQTIDRESQTPVLLDNILVVEMDHRVIDDAGRREINLKSGGKGYLLQKGKAKEIEWRNVEGRIIPYLNGAEVKFVPGKTWVNIIPSSPGIAGAVSIGN